MGKEEILSKFNIKDYNNELENIIEKKAFSEDVKNLLLSMFYKIENGYEDYKKIKALEKTKKEELEQVLNTIDNDCDIIELVAPKINDKTILGTEKAIVIQEQKKLIAYPNEKSIYYGICMLHEPKYICDTGIDILDRAIEKLINDGKNLNDSEVIRDFDGWSWNIEKDDIDNYTYNLIYQNLLFLVDEEILEKWRKNKKYFKNIKEKIGEQLFNNLCKIALQEYIKNDNSSLSTVETKIQEYNAELELMADKKAYLEILAKKKKDNEVKIKDLDNLLSNIDDLTGEFIKTNNNLSENDKIFSLSDFVEIKQTERKKLVDEIKAYSENMKPVVFVEKKTKIKQKLEILKDGLNCDLENKQLIEIQKLILKKILEKIAKIETKKEIYDIIYKLRYLKEIYINRKEKVKDIKELEAYIKKAEKGILTVACNFKLLNILSNSVNENYKIMEEIFDTNMIDLEDIVLEFNKNDNKIVLNIYEDEILSKTIKYENLEDLNIKFNKKIKLFI